MSEPGTSSQCSTPSTCSSPLAVGGCKHYQRNCHLLCPTCDEWFACRFCHDECKETPADRSCVGHKMDRHLVRMIQCQGCGAEQPPGSTCSTCGLCMGRYFCSVCNLFDDEDKQQFHCSDCGICRVGGRENFFHCQTCGACYSNDLKDNHVCISNSMKGQCPVCFDELFDSREPPQVLKCGHTIHRKCLEDYSQHGGFTCPLCSVSIIDTSIAAWLAAVLRPCTPSTSVPNLILSKHEMTLVGIFPRSSAAALWKPSSVPSFLACQIHFVDLGLT